MSESVDQVSGAYIPENTRRSTGVGLFIYFYLLRFAKYTVYITLFNDNKP